MTTTADALGSLARALDVTQRLIDGLRPDQWGAQTPCTEWTVRDLVTHVTAGNRLFASALRGTSGPPADGSVPAAGGGAFASAGAEAEMADAHRASVRDLLGAFGEPGALERTVTVPFGTVPASVALNLRITESLAHGWDLARASGQRAEFPEDVAGQALAFSRGSLSAVPADRRPFAPSRPVPADAPAIDQLAALLGRDV